MVESSRQEMMEALGREFVDAFNRRDADALVTLVSPDLEFHPTALVGEAEVYRGHDGLRHWAAELSSSALQHQVHVREVRVLGEKSFIVLSEILLDGEMISPSAMLAHLGEGSKISEVRAYLSDEEMLMRIGVIPERSKTC